MLNFSTEHFVDLCKKDCKIIPVEKYIPSNQIRIKEAREK
jgi:hypothetical protein